MQLSSGAAYKPREGTQDNYLLLMACKSQEATAGQGGTTRTDERDVKAIRAFLKEAMGQTQSWDAQTGSFQS